MSTTNRIRLVLVALATGAMIAGGVGHAQAFEVTASNDASESSAERPASSGTSGEAAKPGVIHMPGPAEHYTVIDRVPVLDVDGNPVLNQWGFPATRPVYGWVPVDQGVQDAVIYGGAR